MAADAAVDRRADVGVAEVDLRLRQRRPHLQHLGPAGVERRLVLVDDRLRAPLLPGQLELSGILQVGVGRLGLGRGEVRLRLVDLRLELHLLELVKQLARLDVLTFAEQHLVEKALDASAHVDLVDRLDPPDEFEGLADPLQRCRAYADGRRRRRGGLLLGVAAGENQDQSKRQWEQARPHCVRLLRRRCGNSGAAPLRPVHVNSADVRAVDRLRMW